MTFFKKSGSTVVFAATSMACILLAMPRAGLAFFIGMIPQPITSVDEYINVYTGHYFYAPFSDDSRSIAAGEAGPGWVKTGLSFYAYPSLESTDPARYFRPGCETSPDRPCVVVSRFYAPGANSHFFTGNLQETETLKQPGTGWIYEKAAFVVPLPDPRSGQCRNAYDFPVYRLYNNRWMYGDSNHRFTPSIAARDRMIASGWVDEGIAFCAYWYQAKSVLNRMVSTNSSLDVLPAASCRNEDRANRSCIAMANLPIPSQTLPGVGVTTAENVNDEFSSRTGVTMLGNGVVHENLVVDAQSRAGAAAGVFLQFVDWKTGFGIHLATDARGGSPYSNITPLHKLTARAPPEGETDTRLFPFRTRYGGGYELAFSFQLGVRTVVAIPPNHAYGNLAVEFVDSTSDRHLRFNVLTYGTATPADFAARDARDGTALVGTSMDKGSPFGRTLSTFLATDGMTVDPLLSRQYREFRFGASEFQRIVNAARTIDSGLSANPGDYLVDSFGFNNEIYGDGEIGMTVSQIALDLFPL